MAHWGLLACLLALAAGGVTAVAPPTVSSCRNPNDALLTFDDGLSVEYTPTILDYLKENGLPAIFFVKGIDMSSTTSWKPVNPCLMQRMMREGHSVGSHSWNHRFLDKPDDFNKAIPDWGKQLDDVDNLIKQYTGMSKVTFHRPPFLSMGGQWKDAYLRELSNRGYTVVTNCVGTCEDNPNTKPNGKFAPPWQGYGSAQAAVNACFDEGTIQYGVNMPSMKNQMDMCPGGPVILMHDNYPGITHTLDLYIQKFKAAKPGIRFVTASECTGVAETRPTDVPHGEPAGRQGTCPTVPPPSAGESCWVKSGAATPCGNIPTDWTKDLFTVASEEACTNLQPLLHKALCPDALAVWSASPPEGSDGGGTDNLLPNGDDGIPGSSKCFMKSGIAHACGMLPAAWTADPAGLPKQTTRAACESYKQELIGVGCTQAKVFWGAAAPDGTGGSAPSGTPAVAAGPKKCFMKSGTGFACGMLPAAWTADPAGLLKQTTQAACESFKQELRGPRVGCTQAKVFWGSSHPALELVEGGGGLRGNRVGGDMTASGLMGMINRLEAVLSMKSDQ